MVCWVNPNIVSDEGVVQQLQPSWMWLEVYEWGETVTLCHLSKAFDVVSHKLLLAKLDRYGVGSTALTILSSYLSCRSQMVTSNGAVLWQQKVNHVVPQGYILGLLLFL